jgi:hypothetical protein
MKGFNELKDLSTAELIAQRMDKYSKMGSGVKSTKLSLIRSLAVSDFFCYKQKIVIYKQLFVITHLNIFFNFATFALWKTSEI